MAKRKRTDCAIKLEELLGENKALSEKDVDELVEEVAELVKTGELENRIIELKQQKKVAAANKTYERLLHEQKSAEIEEFIFQEEFLRPEQANKAFEALSENSTFLVAGGRLSKENIRATNESDLRLFLDQSLEKNDVEKFYFDPEFEQDITIAAFDLVRGKDISKHPPEIQKVAKIIADLDKYSLTMLHRSGMLVEGRKDHLWIQDHDFAKVTAAKKGPWVEFMQSLNLDENATFGKNKTPKAREKMLGEIWASIVRGDFDMANGPTKAMKRVIHFADGESLHKYNKRFGAGTMQEAINKSIQATARTSATAQKFGAFPKRAWEEAEKKMAERVNELHGPEAAREFEAGPLKRRRDALKKNAFGFDEAPEYNMKTRGLDAVMAINASSKLMNTAVSTFTDFAPALANVVAKTGVGWVEGASLLFKGWTKSLTKNQRRQLGKVLKVHYDQELDKFGVVTGIDGRIGKLSNTAMRFSGMPYLSKVNKSAGSWAHGHLIAKQADKSFDQLDAFTKSQLNQFSITAKEWDILRRAVVDDEGFELIAPGEVMNMDIKGVSDNAKWFAVQKMVGLLQHEGGRISSPSTGVKTRAFINQGISPNTAIGKALTAIWQFKAFPLEIKNVITEIVTANPNTKSVGFTDAIRHKDNAKIMGGLMVNAFVAATLGLWARDLMAGLEPRDMTKPENALEALSRGVFPLQFSYMFDTLKGDYAGWGRSFIRDAAGPTGALVDDLVRLGSTAAIGENVGPQMLRLFKSNMPGIKQPLVYPILNKWFLTELSEMGSPGYIRRQEKRLEEKGQERLVDFFSPF